MVLELIWAAGEVLSIIAVLCGIFLALREAEPFSSLLGEKSVASPSMVWDTVNEASGNR